MGRHKTYDRDVLIGKAMETFRDHGFAGTSTQMLVEGLGVNRYSLYAEFGSKQALFDAALAALPEDRKLFQNKAADVLAVAAAMMRGELAFKSGDRAAGLDHLRRAVALDDGLYYEEPWAWPQPTRHALGALLMEAGDYAEAEAVYRADLGLDPALPRALQNPGNIWALHGLHECLTRRGETAERALIAQALTLAQARADTPVRASCACRSS